MKAYFRFILLCACLTALLSSGWVCYSEERKCPEKPREIGEGEFFSAHGLTQENFSIWLREHSEWRRKYSSELECFTFIPQDDFDTERK